MELVAATFGDGGVDMMLRNGDRVFVEPYNPDLHPGLDAGDGATAKTGDGWTLVRRGDDVVCIAPLASL
jgi:hypothetical protein